MYKSGICLFLLLIISQSLKSQIQPEDSILLINPINLDKNVIVNPKGLSRSFQRLKTIQAGADSTFVVVHFGDSHIQMGHFSGAIEKNLQSIFGDAGNGILFPYSACRSIGPSSLSSNFTGTWEFNNINSNASKIPIGVKGYGLKTEDTTAKFNINYLPGNKPSAIKSVSIFHGVNNFEISCENSSKKPLVNFSNSDWQSTRFYNDTKSANFSFLLTKTDQIQSEFTFHGILFETSQHKGVQYHHCGVVGAKFPQITQNTPLLISQLAQLKPNLILFSYGSNETYLPNFDSKSYIKEIVKFIKQIKAEIPEVEILITSAPDTKSNNQNPLHKNEINKSLAKIVANTEVSYWDLDAVMGGDSTMDVWRNAGLAQKDKLHFFKSGYQLQGNMLSLAFLEAYNKATSKSVNINNIQTEIDNQMTVFSKKVAVPQPEKKGKTITHVIKKGDTLSNIAKKYRCSIASIKKANKLTSETIKIGDTLTIIPNKK